MQPTAYVPPTPPPDLFRKHRLDLQAVENGKWVQVGDDRFLVASYTAKSLARIRAELMAELGLSPDAEIPEPKREWVQEQIFGRCILRDIKPKEVADYAYQAADGYRIFSDPELASLRNQLQAAALGDYTRDAVAKAAILGNC